MEITLRLKAMQNNGATRVQTHVEMGPLISKWLYIPEAVSSPQKERA
jgi:hypothetical protein